MKHLLPLGLVALATFVVSCNDPGPIDPPDTAGQRPAIYGTVKSADGTPVSGMRVALLFDIEPAGDSDTTSSRVVVLPNPVDGTMEIPFEVPAADSVRVDIVRAYDSVVVANLVAAVLPPGTHRVAYDALMLPNLFYKVRLKIGERTLWHTFLVNAPQLDSMRGITRTGANGTFLIEYSWLQLSARLNQRFENGSMGGALRIRDSLSVLVERPGSTPIVWRIKVDTSVAVSGRFTIE